MRAPNPYMAHMARLHTHKTQQVTRNPQGNYSPSQFQWGFIHSINAGPPPSVNIYLDGTQTTSNTAYLTNNVRYSSDYVPNVGDTVLVYRGAGVSSSDRVVLLKLAGSATPTPSLFSGYNSTTNQYFKGPNAMWGGAGIPDSSLGTVGDYYFRTDATSTAGERLYVYESTGWVATSL